MAKMSTSKLVDAIFRFCQAYSGVEFFPYQAQFAKRIIRSTLDNDGDEITALFSRQCLSEKSKILMADGTYKNIEDVKIGDKILSFDYNKLVISEVINSYSAGRRPVVELILENGYRIKTTTNHRYLDTNTKLFRPLGNFEYDDELAYLDIKTGKIESSYIKDIKHIGEEETRDIEVMGTENFIANNIVVHNSGKSETVATVSGGMAIILPILANMPMFADDPRFAMYKQGLMIGIFAPTLKQAQISFARMKKRMSTEHSQMIMADPEIGVNFDISNGQNIMLTNGSLICSQSASPNSNIEGDSCMIIIVDEAQDVGNFKYRKSISPMGAFYNATKILIGTASNQKGFFLESILDNKNEYETNNKVRNHFEYDCNVVTKYNPNYAKYIQGEKKRLGENSDEFQMSYKLKWILSRGMFITDKALDGLIDKKLGLEIMGEQHKTYVMGLDLGKKQDSTIITILELDTKNPLVLESNNPDEEDYIVYPTKLVYWGELAGDDWEDQYESILMVSMDFNVSTIVMDATGVGDVIYDRLKSETSADVVPYVLSSVSKSNLYKHLNSEIRGKRIIIPGDEETQSSREFEKFTQQMLDLEKTFSGNLLKVAHPDVSGAHDDYPDSLALAVWGARGDGVAIPETQHNSAYGSLNDNYTRSTNNITARRR